MGIRMPNRNPLMLVMGMILVAALLVGFVPASEVLDAAHSQLSDDSPRYYDSHPPAAGDGSSSYVLAAVWGTTNLTYSFENCPTSMDCATAHSASASAVEAWGDVSALTLTQVATGGDIRISWHKGAHGDGVPFDGPGGILAHAFFPVAWLPNGLAGDIHIDDDEAWVVGTPTSVFQTHLPTTVMHEAGHALGLDHSENPDALMWAEYAGVRGFHADDIAGIQALYGPPPVTDLPTATPIPTPTPTPEPGSPPPGTPSDVTGAASSPLNLREGPGTNYNIVIVMQPGIWVPVLGRNAEHTWYYVEYEGHRGWVSAWYLIVRGNVNSLPVVAADGSGAAPPADPGQPNPPPPPVTPEAPGNPAGVTATTSTNLRMRSGPGTAYDEITTIPYQTRLSPTGRSSDGLWLYVKYQDQEGWVAAWLCYVNGDLYSLPVVG